MRIGECGGRIALFFDARAAWGGCVGGQRRRDLGHHMEGYALCSYLTGLFHNGALGGSYSLCHLVSWRSDDTI